MKFTNLSKTEITLMIVTLIIMGCKPHLIVTKEKEITVMQSSPDSPQEMKETRTPLSPVLTNTSAQMNATHLPNITSSSVTVEVESIVSESTASATQIPPTLTPVVVVHGITETLLFDGERGRIYANADVDGQRQVVALSTKDGSLLTVYPFSGRLALDRNHHRLLIDQGPEGIKVLDSIDGGHFGEIKLPITGVPTADPQVDPNSGTAYAFRNNSVFVLEVMSGTIIMSKTISIDLLVCGEAHEKANIGISFYDPLSNTLYLSFINWICTGFVQDTLFEFDASTMSELGSFETASFYQAIPLGGVLYGTSRETRLSIRYHWAYGNGEIRHYESIGGYFTELTGITIDTKRMLLYESINLDTPGEESGRQIWISSIPTRTLLNKINIDELPVKNAHLVGHDSITDNLYFLENGELIIIPTSSILPLDY